MRLREVFVIAFALAVAAGTAHGQELEPRAFSPGPKGLNIAAIATSYSSGELVFDASLPIKDTTGHAATIGAGYQRFFSLAGRTAKVAVFGAYADSKAKGLVANQEHRRDFSGLTDPRIAMSWIFAGAPAMTPKEFATYRPRTLAGYSISISPPLGAYENDKLLNVGTNRWTFRNQLGVSAYRGRWTLEGIAGLILFSDNDEFFGSSKQEQDPIGSIQGHVAFNFRRQMWIAGSATYYRGGGTTVDEVSRPGFQANSRYGLTASIPLAKGQSLSFNLSRGLTTRTGSDYDTAIVTWATRWMD